MFPRSPVIICFNIWTVAHHSHTFMVALERPCHKTMKYTKTTISNTISISSYTTPPLAVKFGCQARLDSIGAPYLGNKEQSRFLNLP